MRFFGLIFLMLLQLPVVYSQQKRNPYGLPITSTIAEYLHEVEQNPDNRLLNIQKLIPEAQIRMPYADTNNFTGQPIYTQAMALLRKPVAMALVKVQSALDSLGYTLLIYDAYRPYEASLKFYEVYPDTMFVAAPWKGSRHNRGAAVDVGLIEKYSGRLVPMPTDFDDFSKKASPTYMELPANIILNRELLIQIMRRYGFEVYPSEWWHFDFRGWNAFSILNLTFDEIIESE